MRRLRLAMLIGGALLMVIGCAQDSWTSRQATGYNGFVNKIAQECYPLELGAYQMSQMIQRNSIDDNYIYFLDETSRVYYGQITQGEYRSSINGFFLGGKTTDIALDCILSKLPQNQK